MLSIDFRWLLIGVLFVDLATNYSANVVLNSILCGLIILVSFSRLKAFVWSLASDFLRGNSFWWFVNS